MFVVAPDVVFHPTNVGVIVDAVVIVGIVTSQLVGCTAPLYVIGNIQYTLVVLDNVPPPLADINAAYVDESFFVIA